MKGKKNKPANKPVVNYKYEDYPDRSMPDIHIGFLR